MVDSNLYLRIFSSFLILMVFIASLVMGDVAFFGLVLSLVLLSAFELNNIVITRKVLVLLIFFMIILPYSSLLYIYKLPQGVALIIWLVFTIWSVDVTAYFVGKHLGGWRILPIVSPNKTWSGLLGGILAAIFTSLIFAFIQGLFTIYNAIIIGFVIAIVAQIGDFSESFIKRIYQVKDSGNVVPGHGGILDRMDGFIFTAPLVAYCIKFFCKIT